MAVKSSEHWAQLENNLRLTLLENRITATSWSYFNVNFIKAK